MGRISALTELTSLSASDSLIVLDESANIAKKITVANAFGLPEVGWTATGETWTFSSWSADTYSGVITVPSDATAKYNAGMRIRISQTTGGTKYGIITKVTSTTLTVFFGTDYTLNNETISTPVYSVQQAPIGFPLDPLKWSITTVASTTSSKSSPATNTWYGNTALSATGPNLKLPTGSWYFEYNAQCIFSNSSSPSDVYVSLSTSANSESDVNMTTRYRSGIAGTATWVVVLARRRLVTVTADTTYYLICKTGTASTSTIGISDSVSPNTIIRAVTAYL